MIDEEMGKGKIRYKVKISLQQIKINLNPLIHLSPEL